jgi:hypothetical protein
MAVRRIVAGTLAALVLPLLLAGCGGDTSVADPPVASSPSSPTSSAPPAHESAEHFIRRWVAEDTRIQQTGDTDRFRAMSVGCIGCIKLANLVDQIYDAGGYVHTKGWTIRGISPAGDRTFDVHVYSAPTTYTKFKNGPVHHLPSGPAHFQLRLKPSGDAWRVSYLVQVEQ